MIYLQDSNQVLHHFSADKNPTLYCALPALKYLQSAWEVKLKDLQFKLYHDAIKDGLAKLMKYYQKFDEKPAYILALGTFYIFHSNPQIMSLDYCSAPPVL
jgi:hypothetical protein